MTRYILALQTAQFRDPYLMTKSLSVMHMVEPSSSLFKPDVAVRLLWNVLNDRVRCLVHGKDSHQSKAYAAEHS